MVSVPRPHRPQISATRREDEDERVRFLELFFDLVFVLALTQVTAAMADEPTWEGLARGVLVMGILWWAWVGYAWLTSVIDPEEGAVRIVFFVAMAAFLVAALCVPEAFGDLGLTIAIAYGVVRVCHIFLFMLASADDPELRRSVIGLAVSTAISVALLVGAAALDGWAQGALWALALLLDAGGPYFFGSEGWKLAPEHFAERHGLILIVALGESIVAIGAGVETAVTIGVIARRSSASGSRRASGGSTSTSPRSHRRDGWRRWRTAGSATSSRATPTPTSTSCSSPGSCWSRSA